MPSIFALGLLKGQVALVTGGGSGGGLAIAATPLKRRGTPEVVARAVAYLASPAGDWVPGGTVCIDGGARLWGNFWSIPDPVA